MISLSEYSLQLFIHWAQMNGDLAQCQQNFLFVFYPADLCLRGILGIRSKHGKKNRQEENYLLNVDNQR